MAVASQQPRFEFGQNWSHYLSTIDEQRIAAAAESLQQMLRLDSLQGKRFLDIGSGSGLFSLAAQQLGASIVSFDCDPQSVVCTSQLKERFADAADWRILQGSALDQQFLEALDVFDVVYAWGVLHHTGQMWRAIELAATKVKPGGLLWLAVYNDQQYISRIWRIVKQIYQWLPRYMRPIYVAAIGAALFLKRASTTLLACLLRLVTLRNPVVPIQNWLAERHDRGMHAWYDLVDWVGGWPFEVARPEEVFRFLRDRGFSLEELKTCGGGHGCNEFLFRRASQHC
jgi:2-polyprenyl-3-methyl-5-hydroxy-6-metoxy-1,4-benzoquinol methylase